MRPPSPDEEEEPAPRRDGDADGAGEGSESSDEIAKCMPLGVCNECNLRGDMAKAE